MKLSVIFPTLLLIAQSASAHYIFQILITGTKTSTHAVRAPTENSPVHNYTSPDIRCNINTRNASETVSVSAGSRLGFQLGEGKRVFHVGPGAMYLGRAPGGVKASEWDGSGKRWFKIAEWGAKFKPFGFTMLGESVFTTTIPPSVPSGEYLVRMEQIALHQPGYPEFFVSCAQIKITNGGTASPKMVSIPGYVSAKTDPGLTVDIYWPVPTAYKVPGPPVFTGA